MKTDYIFVFGSNLAGRHGAGAALHALKHHGAIYGCGSGPQGDSYALPTKDSSLNSLPLLSVYLNVCDFLTYVRDHPELDFQVTQIGCGYAGFTPRQIAPLFFTTPAKLLLRFCMETLARS